MFSPRSPFLTQSLSPLAARPRPLPPPPPFSSPSAQCDSCWAMTATDALAHLTSILNWNTPVVLSTQQACSCGIGLCCQGGWPEWVFAYVAYNGGISNETTMPYAANEQTCPASSSLPPSTQVCGNQIVM